MRFHSFLWFAFCIFRCVSEAEVSAGALENKQEEKELPEYLQLHQMVVRKISEICRIVNQVHFTALDKIVQWKSHHHPMTENNLRVHMIMQVGRCLPLPLCD